MQIFECFEWLPFDGSEEVSGSLTCPARLPVTLLHSYEVTRIVKYPNSCTT
ncbi:hypothetical protein EYZ11_009624 [Aspergillus tanneri]|uniref:Uncharacterized protein n=1 Tax=Aspergillus tanneri TaxID=1220188 RepID=A0A4S3J9K1_9EURO|nr:hypothetical protein EYZ11_009624 [Aspergillus tanneri]